MQTTDLKNFKPKTKIVKLFNSPIFFELKSIDIEDIYEVLNLEIKEIQSLGKNLDTTNNKTFLTTLLQENQAFVEKILVQCVVNYENLEDINNMLIFTPAETKIEMMIAVFDLSWSSIQKMLEQTENVKDRINMVLDFLKGLNYHNEN